MKTVLAIALAVVAVPAFAADPAVPAAIPTAVAASPTPSASADRRICVVTPAHTGTIIEQKVCRTRADWAKRGIDPFTAK